jgi:hypothetical protein
VFYLSHPEAPGGRLSPCRVSAGRWRQDRQTRDADLNLDIPICRCGNSGPEKRKSKLCRVHHFLQQKSG